MKIYYQPTMAELDPTPDLFPERQTTNHHTSRPGPRLAYPSTQAEPSPWPPAAQDHPTQQPAPSPATTRPAAQDPPDQQPATQPGASIPAPGPAAAAQPPAQPQAPAPPRPPLQKNQPAQAPEKIAPLESLTRGHEQESKAGENSAARPFGEVISSYTRAEAMADGFLVDLNRIAPSVCRQHFKHHIAATAAVWNIIDKAVKNPHWYNDYNGVIHDILFMARYAPGRRMINQSTALFKVIITGAGRKRYHNLKLKVHPGDHAEPVITIMLPNED